MKGFELNPVWLVIISLSLSGISEAAEIYSAQSGNWGSGSTWVGGTVPTQNDNVIILNGHTITIESSGKSCANLTVNNGGKLFTNNSSSGSSPRYVNLYGNILCEGQIGNGSTYDLIGFNIEGESCTISGNGSFDAARLRKYSNINTVSTLTISMNIRLRIGGTALYNNKSGTIFHVFIDAGDTVIVPGDGILSGNVAIDGVNGGASSTGGGTISVNGTLSVSGILYLTNSNSANPAAVNINTGGWIETGSISCPNSGASGHTFTIQDGGKLTLSSGNWGEIGFTNNSYVFYPGSTVEYAGDSTQTIGQPAGYHHLILSGNGIKKIQEDMIIGGNLVIENGSALIVDPEIDVSVMSDCSYSGTECLILKSPMGSGPPASFIIYGNLSGNGTVQVERFLSRYVNFDDSRYHMISSPVTTQLIQPDFVSSPPAAGIDFYRWDEPGGSWVNSKDGSGGWNTEFQPGDDRHFIPGCGYLVAYPEDDIKMFSGPLNTGDLSPDISYTNGVFAGFNLIGNPYSSALKAEIGTWGKSHVDNAVWVWDGEAGNYKCWNGVIGTLEGGIIPAMQGFFVHANSPNPLLTIPASSRVHSALPFYKTTPENTLHLSVKHGFMNDGVVLQFHESSTTGFDTCLDVLKFYGSQEAPQLFCIANGTYLSVDVRPFVDSGMKIDLGFMAGKDGEYIFEWSGLQGFSICETVFLVDRKEDKIINLASNPEYRFHAPAGFVSDRFLIRVGYPAGEEEKEAESRIRITTKRNSIIVTGLEEYMKPVRVSLVDLSGRVLVTHSVTCQYPIIETDLTEGMYLVIVYGHDKPLVTKIHLTN